jgi:hypothetical protein
MKTNELLHIISLLIPGSSLIIATYLIDTFPIGFTFLIGYSLFILSGATEWNSQDVFGSVRIILTVGLVLYIWRAGKLLLGLMAIWLMFSAFSDLFT